MAANFPSILQPISEEVYARKLESLHTASRKKRGARSSVVSSFPNRVVTYFGHHKAQLECDPYYVATHVELFVKEVLGKVAQLDARFKGVLLPCGSYYEGVKVKHPNEFDYIWKLDSLKSEDLRYTQVIPKTFKPHKHKEIYGRTYFSLGFRDDTAVPPCWSSAQSGINPRQLQEDFHVRVQKAASRPDDRQLDRKSVV